MIFTLTPNPGIDRTLIVPELRHNDVLRASAVNLGWGGKGFNVSRVLKILGMESTALGFVGGCTGRMLEDGLHSLGVHTDFVHIASETRTNIVIQQDGSPEHIKVNEGGPEISKDELEMLYDKVTRLACSGDIWLLAGSLPRGVPVNFYARLVTILKAKSVRVFLDASGETMRLGCVAGPDWIKPNVDEAREITGINICEKADAIKAAHRFFELGVGCVAISMGAGGLLFVPTYGKAYLAVPPLVKVRMVTGAGDSAVAGMIWATIQDLPPAEVARSGAALGTASVLHCGVSEIIPTEVSEISAQVRLEEF